MPTAINVGTVRIPLEPLTPSAFAPFGTVIANPSRKSNANSSTSSSSSNQSNNGTKTTTADAPPEPKPEPANQGTAQRYPNVSPLANFYTLAPSARPAPPSMSIFACSPRKLRVLHGAAGADLLLDVPILERHPFTTQTFVPMAVPADTTKTCYIVVVAPTLPGPSPIPRRRGKRSKQSSLPHPYPPPPKKRRSLKDVFARARPAPYDGSTEPPTGERGGSGGVEGPRGVGAPDLKNLRAFLATGDQAVTYGVGTWHAPMAVVGERVVDFVVVQHMSGIAAEDVEEVELRPGETGEGVAVMIKQGGAPIETVKSKL